MSVLTVCFLTLLIHAAFGGSTSTGTGAASPSGGAGWEYDGPLGPDQWYTAYPQCGGRMQSPINIDTAHVLYDRDLHAFDLSGYSSCRNCRLHLENVNGHTAEVKYSGDTITVKGGNLPDDYILDQFHFHWGASDYVGSEHKLNFKASPLEMHIVHHMAKYNSTYSAQHPYGLAVLGFFFEVAEQDNEKLNVILDYFKNITHRDDSIEIEPFALIDLLPDGDLHYYRYYGSLTTPPCYETVIWTIFTQKIQISQKQLNMFRSLMTVKAGQQTEVVLANDYRPTQALNERRVTTNDDSVLHDVTSVMVKQLTAQIEDLRMQCNVSAARAVTSSLWMTSLVALLLGMVAKAV